MTTVQSELPTTGVCDCGDDVIFHYQGTGPCDYHPDPMVSECSCIEFHESPRYQWVGPHVDLARSLEAMPAVPTFFIFEAGTLNVLFDEPVRNLAVEGFNVWCRLGEVPEDLAQMASRAREDDAVATVFLDALLERGLARGANGVR